MRTSVPRLMSSGAWLFAGAALIAGPVLAQDPTQDSTEAPAAATPAVMPAPSVETPALADPALDTVPVVSPVVEPAEPIPAIWAPAPTDAEGNSAYGLYLSGRLAGMRGDREVSAGYLARTHALTPEQPKVADEAFRAALFAGEIATVVRLTGDVGSMPLLAEAGRLFTAVEALRRNDGRAALATMTEQAFQPPYDRAASYLDRAVRAAGGDWDAALAPVPAEATMPTALILRSQRARLLEARRRFDEADTEYRALVQLPGGQRLYGVDYAAFLERRGKRTEALAAYAASLNSPTPDPRALTGAHRLQGRGRAPAAPTIQQIAGEAMEFAALEMSELSSFELAVIYLQLASALNPGDDVTLRLAQNLAKADQEQLALDAYARVGSANPIQYAVAQVGLADLLAEEDRRDEALEALRRADAAAPTQAAVARRLAAGLIDLERFDEALQILDRPAVSGDTQSPEIHFLRGFALSRVNRLDEAEAELWTALQATPDNPTLLNQLGYLWVDSGRRVSQGAEMLARAHAADPANGNIQDSLGWAQYRQGQYDAAVLTLEEAVAKEPGNAEIVDHLGDAYWQVGRKREAEWQWSRVLTLEPEPDRRVTVQAKLEGRAPDNGPLPPTTASQP